MKKAIPIIKNHITLTPYRFYNEFLYEVATSYIGKEMPIEFNLIDGNDDNVYGKKYSIDPITIPLLLSLTEQFSKLYKTPVKLNQNLMTDPLVDLLEFLYSGDFFYLAGNNKKSPFPIGRCILEFNWFPFKDFEEEKYNVEHKVRAFSLDDKTRYDSELTIRGALSKSNIKNDELKRNFLIEETSYKIDDYFYDLLHYNDNEFTSNQTNFFINILAELITNGIWHSGSDVYAMMFVNRFGTRFSISDNGIGAKSLSLKKDFLYKNKELFDILEKVQMPFSLPPAIKTNLLMIFEMLFYSMIKKREGLFDLMSNVVLDGNGYFRLHTERSQIIISKRMESYLSKLRDIRQQIRDCYDKIQDTETQMNKKDISDRENQNQIEQMQSVVYEENRKLSNIIKNSQNTFKSFYADTINKHNADVMYSSVRFYGVKFNGIHIEVEIPNPNPNF